MFSTVCTREAYRDESTEKKTIRRSSYISSLVSLGHLVYLEQMSLLLILALCEFLSQVRARNFASSWPSWNVLLWSGWLSGRRVHQEGVTPRGQSFCPQRNDGQWQWPLQIINTLLAALVKRGKGTDNIISRLFPLILILQGSAHNLDRRGTTYLPNFPWR